MPEFSTKEPIGTKNAENMLGTMKNTKAISTLALSSAAIASQAAIIGVAGQGDILTNLATVGYTANYFNDTATVVHGWDEMQNVTLDRAVKVDINAMGTYQNSFTSANATIKCWHAGEQPHPVFRP